MRLKNAKKKLLLGITKSEIGGSQKVVYALLSNLPEEDFDLTLITSPDGELIKWITSLNSNGKSINIIAINALKRDVSLLNDIFTFLQLIKIIRRGKYDIVHFHNSKIGILGRLAAWIARVPKIIYTVHGCGLNNSKSSIQYKVFVLLEKLACFVSTKIICVCHSDMEKGVKEGWIKRDKVCVIHNGIEDIKLKQTLLRKIYNIPENVPVLATVMRLNIPKEPVFTIKVADRLRSFGYIFKLLIIGDGPLRAECEQLIDELEMGNFVAILGLQENVRELIQDIDIFLLFSRWEGLPIAIIEAMFAGKPIVASNVGGIKELVSHNENGYLLDNFNVNAGADFIKILLDDSTLRQKQGRLSRKISVKEYSIDRMLEKHIAVYSE